MEKHSVSVFKSAKHGGIFMFPVGVKPNGVPAGVNKPIVDNSPYTTEQLGKSVKDCFEISINKKYNSNDFNDPTISVTGIKSNSKFVKEYSSVDVSFDNTTGYTVRPLFKQKNGAYSSKEGIQKELPEEVSNTELGQAVLEAFKQCEI
ncbi:contact-dependent growth inhibition system immunity protein [Marinicrinis sediminis]|uniref:Contact-dependent growth inhibition system immunity protein n=1 Tax=Marinicrinis sediminis TaxID=1652465 RepID=A0ABW5RAM2_9BACL